MKDQYVFIATHRRGFEADPIIDDLRGRGVPVFRFNCEAGLDISRATINFKGGKPQLQFSCDGRAIDAASITLAWYQQPPPFLGQPADAMQCLQRENVLAEYYGALSLLQCSWFNPPDAVHRAGNKVLQLVAAANAGLLVPTTCISNDPDAVRRIYKRGPTIAKNLATPWIDISNGKTLAAYTKVVEASWLEDADGMQFCPVIYQSRSVRKRDFRIVVVGKKAFAAACIPNTQQQVDVRRGDLDQHGYRPCQAPDKCLDGLVRLMEHFGIHYCSADFMEDQEGCLYFLDLNSCGAWWWVDCLYEGAIRKAITSHLSQLYETSRKK